MSTVPGGDKKIVAGITGIVLGAIGVHKFVLGYTKEGLIMLGFTLLTFGIGGPLVALIGLIEGIVYLTRTDEEFVATYVQGHRGWF
jgi:TM2 domain-containing membrane protein YozV